MVRATNVELFPDPRRLSLNRSAMRLNCSSRYRGSNVQSRSYATSSLINLWSATRRQFYHKSSADRHDHPNVGAQTIAERHKYWKHWYAVSSLDSLPRRQTEVPHLPRTISSHRRHRCESMHTLQPCTTITSIYGCPCSPLPWKVDLD